MFLENCMGSIHQKGQKHWTVQLRSKRVLVLQKNYKYLHECLVIVNKFTCKGKNKGPRIGGQIFKSVIIRRRIENALDLAILNLNLFKTVTTELDVAFSKLDSFESNWLKCTQWVSYTAQLTSSGSRSDVTCIFCWFVFPSLWRNSALPSSIFFCYRTERVISALALKIDRLHVVFFAGAACLFTYCRQDFCIAACAVRFR